MIEGAGTRGACSVRCSTATRYPPNARRTEAECIRLSVLARHAAVAVERLAASGRLPVACVAVSARQTAAYVAVGRARGDHWPDERVALLRVVVVYPRGAEPGLARPARRRRRCLQGRPPVGRAAGSPGRLLASSWRPRGRCPVAPAGSEAEAAANAHIVVGDVSQDVVEIPTGLTPRAQVLQPRRLITASPVIPIGFPPLVVRSVQHTVGRSASQTVITARPASAGAGNRTAEERRNNEPLLRRYSAVVMSSPQVPPQETNPASPGLPLTHWRPGRSSGQRSAGLWPSLSRAPDGEGGPRTPFNQADPARSTVPLRTPREAGRHQANYPEHVRVSSPVSPAVPRARLRGGASHEAKGRRGARGGVGCGQSADAKPEMSPYIGLTQTLAP